MSVSPDQFRTALRQWPSGVSVVTSCSTEPVGLTVSAFFSVSLVPPLVGVCLDRQSATLPVILATGLFGVSVLSTAQMRLSERFASKGDERVRFEGVPLFAAAGARSPLLDGAVLHLDCELAAAHDVGDHVLCVGSIHLALSHPGEPLLFHASRYHRLTGLAREP
ncbi:MAG TPA: flavin reductase family protein [Polyangiaceae bacterium]|nr:flavin reductase family protein [Polyangiaceae bacterium]